MYTAAPLSYMLHSRTVNPIRLVKIKMVFHYSKQLYIPALCRGTKFNARRETAQGETYLGLKIFRFYIRCPMCCADISFKTDIENLDYAIEQGATRLVSPMPFTKILFVFDCCFTRNVGHKNQTNQNRFWIFLGTGIILKLIEVIFSTDLLLIVLCKLKRYRSPFFFSDLYRPVFVAKSGNSEAALSLRCYFKCFYY